MARGPDPRAEQALELYKQGLKLVEIASRLNLPEGTVRSWKNRYKWDATLQCKKCNVAKRKRGGQPGNKNSVGHAPSTPHRNKNAEKYGFFAKYLPDETKEIIDAIEDADPLDLLWHQIQIAYAAIIRAQQIAYVKDQEDKTINLTGEMTSDNANSKQYAIQEAWEKQENFLKAQSQAQSTLRSLIKQYDEMLNKHWELATEEQKARIEKIRADINRGEDGKKEALDKLDEVLKKMGGAVNGL